MPPRWGSPSRASSGALHEAYPSGCGVASAQSAGTCLPGSFGGTCPTGSSDACGPCEHCVAGQCDPLPPGSPCRVAPGAYKSTGCGKCDGNGYCCAPTEAHFNWTPCWDGSCRPPEPGTCCDASDCSDPALSTCVDNQCGCKYGVAPNGQCMGPDGCYAGACPDGVCRAGVCYPASGTYYAGDICGCPSGSTLKILPEREYVTIRTCA